MINLSETMKSLKKVANNLNLMKISINKDVNEVFNKPEMKSLFEKIKEIEKQVIPLVKEMKEKEVELQSLANSLAKNYNLSHESNEQSEFWEESETSTTVGDILDSLKGFERDCYVSFYTDGLQLVYSRIKVLRDDEHGDPSLIHFQLDNLEDMKGFEKEDTINCYDNKEIKVL